MESKFFSFSHSIYQNLLNLNHFQLMNPSGNRHDAADFALVLTVNFRKIILICSIFNKIVG